MVLLCCLVLWVLLKRLQAGHQQTDAVLGIQPQACTMDLMPSLLCWHAADSLTNVVAATDSLPLLHLCNVIAGPCFGRTTPTSLYMY